MDTEILVITNLAMNDLYHLLHQGASYRDGEVAKNTNVNLNRASGIKCGSKY